MRYTTLLFDSDDTLLDFAKSEKYALKYALAEKGVAFSERLHSMYSSVNKGFWAAFEKGEIEKSEIYVGRFQKFLEQAEIMLNPVDMAESYEKHLAQQFFTLENAYQVCEYLKDRYDIYIVTNGKECIQQSRLKGSGIIDLVKDVFVSEAVGTPKPEKKYFDYVFSKIEEKDKSKILIIGDSQSSDILGGINAGIDTCWYNPFSQEGKYTSTYEIKELDQLIKMLDY